MILKYPLKKAVATAIESVKEVASKAYKYKGSDTYANIAAKESPAVGDVWNSTTANGVYPKGTNYAWNGTEWDALGGEVDLSAYQKASDDTLATTSKTVVGAINEVKGVADAAAKADASNITVATWKEKLGFITASEVPEQVQPDWNATSGKGQILNKPDVKNNNIDVTIADARRFGKCMITNENPKFVFLNNYTMRPCQVIAHVSTSGGICDAEYTFNVLEGVIQSPVICERITNADLSNFNIDTDTTEGKHDVFFQNTATSTNAIFISYDIIVKV